MLKNGKMRPVPKFSRREIMAKAKTIFVCSSCGYESAKWLGKCPACNEWNSFYEEKVANQVSTAGGKSSSSRERSVPRKL